MKKKDKRTYKIVSIHWKDAAMHGSAQISVDEAKEHGLMECHSVGILVKETKEYITVAMDFFPAQKNNDGDSFRVLASYPKSGIIKMTTLMELKCSQENK